MIHHRRHGNTPITSAPMNAESGAAAARRQKIADEIAHEQKKTYIEFICKLMLRMDERSLERMLDAAIEEVG